MQLISHLNRHLNLPHLTLQSAIFLLFRYLKQRLFSCKPLDTTISVVHLQCEIPKISGL